MGSKSDVARLGGAGVAQGAQTDNSQLQTLQVNSLFPGGATVQPLPLPLGPAYNTSSFRAFLNVTFSYYADAPSTNFTITQGALATLVNVLGRLYYPQGILFEVGARCRAH